MRLRTKFRKTRGLLVLHFRLNAVLKKEEVGGPLTLARTWTAAVALTAALCSTKRAAAILREAGVEAVKVAVAADAPALVTLYPEH